MFLLSFATLLAISSAAQLPSNAYIPQNQGPSPDSRPYNPSSQGSGSFQGSYQGSQGSFSSYQGSSSFGGAGGSGGSGGSGNRRPQQDQEKNSAILKQDQEINDNGFHYSYETSNGIRAEEAGNAAQTQGGFSYKGDDGNTYTVVFSAGEGGFRPQGDHLPVAPPTPQAILEALEKNAKDEASGIFDDGQYRPGANNGKNGNSGSGFPSGPSFGNANHQGNFNGNTGYHY